MLNNGRKKVNQLHGAHRLLLLSIIRPSMEYGSEVREGNKGQTNALESVVLGGTKKILGCSSKACTCHEAVRGDMGLETLQNHIGIKLS